MPEKPELRELDRARNEAEEALIRYADLARAWNAPDDEHTRYQIRRLVDDVIEDTMQDIGPPCGCGAAGIYLVDGVWFCRDCHAELEGK